MSSEETPVAKPAEEAAPAAPSAPKDDTPAASQLDGAAEPNEGSPLVESDSQVEVTLASMQEDPNNPLYSTVKNFEELNL